MVFDHDETFRSSATTATAAAGFVFGEHGQSGLIRLWFLACDESANGSVGRSFPHSMLGQGAQFAPCRQSLFYTMANGNGFPICIAVVVVSDHGLC